MTSFMCYQEQLSPDETETLLLDIREQEEKVVSFYAVGHITVKGWMWESDARIFIAGIKDPFSLKIEITHMWGRPILHLLIRDGKLEVLSFDEQKIYLGRFTPEALSRFLPGVMADQDLIWSVLRAYPYLINGFHIGDPGPGQINLFNPREEERIELDMETLLVKTVSFPGRGIHLDFSNIREHDNIAYAVEVRMRHDHEKKTLIIRNEKMVFNADIPDPIFTIKRLDSFKMVYLDEEE
ncbi:MAG: hypothetical protein JW932_02605 [Deltaproteobacteria bacterium]|nr:hypothetical protein [Deltaproteobacteria bacterium]